MRRQDLGGSESRSVSPAAEALDDVSQALQARLRSAIELDFVDVAPPTAVTGDGVSAPGTEITEDETFAFKLFATLPTPNSKTGDALSSITPGPTDAAIPTAKPSNNNEANAVQYISLKDEPVNYTLPTRRLSYYIATPPSAKDAARFATSALSTADVLRMSKAPRPGLACPWRVIDTPAVHARSLRVFYQQNTASSSPYTSVTDAANSRGRKRLGKKSRIKLRKELAAREVEEKEKLAASVKREEQIREKKTRMNRAKQARKREKAKMKGEGAGGGGDEGGNGEEG